jgi:HD-GYP domain-containing protein (c-di-GMP phosphodiesterase class II)
MELDFVLEKMRSMSGTRFDPEVVSSLIAAVSAGDVTPPDRQNASEDAVDVEAS